MMYPLLFIFVCHRMADNFMIRPLTFAPAPRALPQALRTPLLSINLEHVFLPTKASNVSPLSFPIRVFLQKKQ